MMKRSVGREKEGAKGRAQEKEMDRRREYLFK